MLDTCAIDTHFTVILEYLLQEKKYVHKSACGMAVHAVTYGCTYGEPILRVHTQKQKKKQKIVREGGE